ncbi:MAG: PD-(D/E)XK nuclease family protein [Candidatus Thermoplasmatota archaeon]|nr:PD-(D/E)XK nuclease family protein [Candidatus Thermoplasmatota archaeon]
MPVGLPPRGGPMGRTRGRLSASALTTYLRCPRQWLLGYQVGLQGPTRPSQILGVVLEEAFCDLLMMHPPVVSSHEELLAWATAQVPTMAASAYEKSEAAWNDVLWTSDPADWDRVTTASIEDRLMGGLGLFMSEVEACFAASGGPYLEQRRAGEVPFAVPEPCLGAAPVYPLPEKVRDVGLRSWTPPASPTWSEAGSAITWHEAWECARPWFKDPRVHQPQRLYHPDGWASGELDMVLRWDGHVRLVDIKLGTPHSAFSTSLEHQLRFYAWLWHETHGGDIVDGMEGWYLEAGERVGYSPPRRDEMVELTTTYQAHYKAMQSHDAGVMAFPAPAETACDGEAAGCGWCSVARTDDGAWSVPERFEWIRSLPEVRMRPPYAPLGEVQGRVAVTGRLTGAWGPMPNHFAEHVLGAVLVVGQQHITLEESEPGAYPDLHDLVEQDVVLFDALPGVWRDQARLYVDATTQIKQRSTVSDDDMPATTRLGLLRTRANVKGHVLSIRQRSGVRIDGKPWSMVSLMLWDGSHVAEVVAFGASINQRLLAIRPGDGLAMTGVELGWRSGILQLRIDNRKTRLETFADR